MYHKKYKIRIIAVFIELSFSMLEHEKNIFHWLGSILSFSGVLYFLVILGLGVLLHLQLKVAWRFFCYSGNVEESFGCRFTKSH